MSLGLPEIAAYIVGTGGSIFTIYKYLIDRKDKKAKEDADLSIAKLNLEATKETTLLDAERAFRDELRKDIVSLREASEVVRLRDIATQAENATLRLQLTELQIEKTKLGASFEEQKEEMHQIESRYTVQLSVAGNRIIALEAENKNLTETNEKLNLVIKQINFPDAKE